MEIENVQFAIKKAFEQHGNPSNIPKQGGSFEAKLFPTSIEVNNLGNSPFLPWSVFEETMNLLKMQDGRADYGKVMLKGARLGDDILSLKTIEGHVAFTIYKKKLGESIFRRSTPIAGILVWAGLCKRGKGCLILAEATRPKT